MMNALIICSSIVWIAVMTATAVVNQSQSLKMVTAVIVAINFCTIIFNFFVEDKRKSIEAKIYNDNISVLLLIIALPKELFYGYPLQVLLSIIICHIYLKNKKRVYNILMLISTLQIFLYIYICYQDFCHQVIYNTLSMVFLIITLQVVKGKVVLDPESKYKDKVSKINELIRNEVVNCITAMNYHIRGLDENNRSKMQHLIRKMNLITQIDRSNFKPFIDVLKSYLLSDKSKTVDIKYIDNTTKDLSFNMYAMYLILYTILESSIKNSSTEVWVKLSDSKIEVFDNGTGYDVRSKLFNESSLKTAIDLLGLFDMPVEFSSNRGSGTQISFSV